MSRAVVHIGLPKTGTSSFQTACFECADSLADEGILYPTDEPFMFGGAVQHQGLAVRMAQGTPESIDEDVRTLREQSEGFDTLLLSAERFASDLRDPATVPKMAAFRDSLNRRFDQVEFVVAIRADRALLRSTLKTKIDGNGMRNDGPAFVRRDIQTFYEMNRAIVDLLGKQLKVLRFEELIAAPFPASLLRACIDRDVSLPDTKRNVSEGKDAKRFLMSSVRILLFQVLGEPNTNTPNVRRAAREFEQGISIAPEVNAKLRDLLDAWIDKEIEAALVENTESLAEIYAPLLAPAVQP